MAGLSVSFSHPIDLSTEPFAYVTIVFVVLALAGIVLRAYAQRKTERAWSPILMIAWVRNSGKHLKQI